MNPIGSALLRSHGLDGKMFYGTELIKGQEERRSEVFLFHDGTFEPRRWAADGLQSGSCMAWVEGDVIVFQSSGLDASGRWASWRGEVEGDQLAVTGVIEKLNCEPIEVSAWATLASGPPIPWPVEQLDNPPAPGSLEYEDALERAHQQRTSARLRNLGTAMYSWRLDQISGERGSRGIRRQRQGMPAHVPGETIDVQEYPLMTAEELGALLVPYYIQEVVATDAWGHPIEVRLNPGALAGERVMCLRSPGRDGKLSGAPYTMSSFPAADFDQDIVWCGGYFIRWPGEP